MRSAKGDDLTVETRAGHVAGTLDRGVPHWAGVPYGRIEQRFRLPAPIMSHERLECTGWGPVSWQVPIAAGKSWSPLFPDAVQDEDYLRLNIWFPEPRGSAPRLSAGVVAPRCARCVLTVVSNDDVGVAVRR